MFSKIPLNLNFLYNQRNTVKEERQKNFFRFKELPSVLKKTKELDNTKKHLQQKEFPIPSPQHSAPFPVQEGKVL